MQDESGTARFPEAADVVLIHKWVYDDVIHVLVSLYYGDLGELDGSIAEELVDCAELLDEGVLSLDECETFFDGIRAGTRHFAQDEAVGRLVALLDGSVNPLRVSLEQTRTELAAFSSRVARSFERDRFWASTVTSLLAPARRDGIVKDLQTYLDRWLDLPPAAQSHLIAARYLTDDPGLLTAEAVPNIIRSVTTAIEVLGRVVLKLSPGANLGAILAHSEDVGFGDKEFYECLRELKIWRNRATHTPGGLGQDEATRVWSLVLGTRGAAGIIPTFLPSEQT